ncbi:MULTISPECIES: hypothetical protein [Mumia]|uniref:Uncharacterized protein n=1 Tax=Mumia xiangluensis TaxID=1678900 RepID=A0ABW1QPR2_9ACTN|nr:MULTISPECIES: hypothetical protein [Mumia]
MIGGVVVVLALVVAMVVVGLRMTGDDGGSDEPDAADSSEAADTPDSDTPDSDGADAGLTADGVALLTKSLGEQENWTCYNTVEGVLARCHYFVAGESAQRASLRIDLADGAVTHVTFAAYLVDDPAPVTAVAAEAVGETLFDGAGRELADAVAAEEGLGPDELDVDASFTSYGDGFQIQRTDASGQPPAPPSPADIATMKPKLAAAGYTCTPTDATSLSCELTDGRVTVRVIGIDHAESAAWNVAVTGASYDAPLDEASVRQRLGAELVKLGLTDDAGATFVGASTDRQFGDFAGLQVEMTVYEGGADAHIAAMVTQVR